jgi:hypothetical protein
MRAGWLIAAVSALAQASPRTVLAADALAEPPSEVSVTVYRAPERSAGSIRLDQLGGFALVSESRTVDLPAGLIRLRFEGVADGIEPASALVAGLPSGVIEKNREGKLLSPASLLDAALDKPVTLLRTDKKTGERRRVAGKVRSDAGGGVVFETAEGVEALRCSGLPESFAFTGVADLSATPTLSVLVRSAEAVTRTVTLSYLARGFDWSADYSATVSTDGNSIDLGAWVTLANGNGVGFPSSHAEVVAGRVNRENGEVEAIDFGGPLLAQCWPRGSTSDSPQLLQLDSAIAGTGRMQMKATFPAPAAALNSVSVTARRVEQEQLGDLKLYSVPGRTTIAGRQAKQVRLLDRSGIPVNVVYGADFGVDETGGPSPASRLLRTMNTTANHLGLPLPSGRIAVYAVLGKEKLLQHESGIRDLAVGEEVEINMGESPDVQVTVVKDRAALDSDHAPALPLVPGAEVRKRAKIDVCHVDISNARAAQIEFEVRLRLPEGGRIVRADQPLRTKNGRPMFRLAIPANKTVTLRYQIQRVAG